MSAREITIHDVNAETVRFLYRGVSTAFIVNVGLAVLTCLVLWKRVDTSSLSYWFAAICLLIVARVICVCLFRRSRPDDEQINKWKYAFLFLSSLSGLTWGMSIWFFAPYADLISPLLITFVLGGITAGAAALLGAVRLVYFSYVVVTIMPLTAWFFLQGTETHTIMATMLCIYMLAMFMGGNIYFKVLVKSISLSHQLVHAKEAAEQASRAKSEFLSSMSHELRTPLNAILGFGQILGLQGNEQTKNISREIVNAGQHLLSLIEDVLDLSAIEAGKLQLSMQAVPVNLVIEESCSLINPVAEQKGVSVVVLPAADTELAVWADQQRLKQVILNMLSNAIKYNKDGGDISVHYQNKDDSVRIIISDTGIGMSIEQQEHLFEEFNRVGAENSNIEGTGLGLVISKKIITAMGGNIGVESEKGRGSSFWVELRRA